MFDLYVSAKKSEIYIFINDDVRFCFVEFVTFGHKPPSQIHMKNWKHCNRILAESKKSFNNIRLAVTFSMSFVIGSMLQGVKCPVPNNTITGRFIWNV